VRELAASGLIVLADKGHHGAGEHIRTPYQGRNKPAWQKEANRAHSINHALFVRALTASHLPPDAEAHGPRNQCYHVAVRGCLASGLAPTPSEPG
jgi:hypothetical protein